jgi:hypothetical protein
MTVNVCPGNRSRQAKESRVLGNYAVVHRNFWDPFKLTVHQTNSIMNNAIRMINNTAEVVRHARKSFDFCSKGQDDIQSLTKKNQQLMDDNKKHEDYIRKINEEFLNFSQNWKRKEAENASLKESIQDLSADWEASSKAHQLQIQELIKANENLRKEVESVRYLSEVKDDELQREREMNNEKIGVIQGMEVENRRIWGELLGKDDLLQKKETEIQRLNKEFWEFWHLSQEKDDELQRERKMNIEKDGVIEGMELENRRIWGELLGKDDLLQKKETEIQRLNKESEETYQCVKCPKSAARKRSLDQASRISDNKRVKKLPPSDIICESSATNKVSFGVKKEVDDDSTVTMDYSPFHSPSV